MSSNRGFVYLGQGKGGSAVDRLSEDGRFARPDIGQGVILKVVTTNYLRFGSAHGARPHDGANRPRARSRDYRRSDLEVGRDVETLAVGDLVSVPFNVACGYCPDL